MEMKRHRKWARPLAAQSPECVACSFGPCNTIVMGRRLADDPPACPDCGFDGTNGEAMLARVWAEYLPRWEVAG